MVITDHSHSSLSLSLSLKPRNGSAENPTSSLPNTFSSPLDHHHHHSRRLRCDVEACRKPQERTQRLVNRQNLLQLGGHQMCRKQSHLHQLSLQVSLWLSPFKSQLSHSAHHPLTPKQLSFWPLSFFSQPLFSPRNLS